MYFDSNESLSHKKAKEKLFDLIVQKRIEIVDQYDNVYEIFNGRYKDEFLHIESFIMDYSNEAIFSNEKSPCIKHLEDYKKKGLCDAKGYYGGFKELPCERCVIKNFRKHLGSSSKFASYRPDVSFGYNGNHKIWLEIKSGNPCSKNKIDFCKENGIILLEIKDFDVLNFNDYHGQLVFNKLEEYVHIPNVYEDIDNIIHFAHDELNVQKYLMYTEVIGKINEASSSKSSLAPRNILLLTERIESELAIVNADRKELMDYFGLIKKCKIIISKLDYEAIKESGYITEEKVDGIQILNASISTKMVRCHNCKGKEQAKNLIKVEEKLRNGKPSLRFYHNECLKINK